MTSIHILLVDDNVNFLEAATSFLAGEPLLKVVGQAVSGGEALQKSYQLRPDLILLDLILPDLSGFEVARRLKAQPDSPRIIILTMYDQPEYRALAEAVRVDGFMCKSDVGLELLPLIGRLVAGLPTPKTAPGPD
jgi:DNA-binding NarL/FixJ family response regulator